jgi:hypothetical protein
MSYGLSYRRLHKWIATKSGDNSLAEGSPQGPRSLLRAGSERQRQQEFTHVDPFLRSHQGGFVRE